MGGAIRPIEYTFHETLGYFSRFPDTGPASRRRITVDRFVEAQVSSRKTSAQRGIKDLLGTLAAGDRLIVSELSRLGRSLGQVIRIVDELVKQKVRFVAIKEAIRFEGKQDMQPKVMIALFGLNLSMLFCGASLALCSLTNRWVSTGCS